MLSAQSSLSVSFLVLGLLVLLTGTSIQTHLSPSAVTKLPIIYVNPGDLSCIYSTLPYVQDQGEKMGVNTSCITYYQPLWVKVMEIVSSKAIPVVVIFSGFHCSMSFPGNVGALMQGSGLLRTQ